MDALYIDLNPQVDLVQAAQTLATRAHAGQTDKLGNPYIEHPAAVVTILQTLDQYPKWNDQQQSLATAAAWLHDALEDNDAIDPISMLAIGFPARLIQILVALTHTPHEPRAAYLERVLNDPIATTVKIADTIHNSDPRRLGGIPDDATRQRLTDKYERQLATLLNA